MIKKICILIISIISLQVTKAQIPIGKITGIVQEKESNLPLEYATIVFKNLKDSTVSGILTDEKGKFIIENIKPGAYSLDISFLGYKNYFNPIIKVIPPNMELNLGTLFLETDAQTLESVTIVAEKNLIQLGNEKKIFNVDKTPIASSGTLSGVLKQIPSVDVDNEGKVTLRGSENIIIYINGKPSGIAGANMAAILESFPSTSIESIELITNPSSKYEAQGGAGIINIVLKKNLDKGYNGNVGIGFGTLYSPNANLGINFRSKKLSFTSNYGIRFNEGFSEGNGTRKNILNDTVISYLNNNDRYDYISLSNTISNTFDYNVNDLNTLYISNVLSQSYTKGRNNNDFYFLDNLNELVAHNKRTGDRKKDKNYGTDLNIGWQKKFTKPQQILDFSTTYSYNNNSEYARFKEEELITNTYIETEENLNKKKNHLVTAQIDYSQPFTKKNGGKLDVGTKTSYRNYDFKLNVDSLNRQSNSYETVIESTNQLLYKEKVLGIYANYSNSYKSFTYRAGLRTEYTNIDIRQKIGDIRTKYDYWDYFPSAGISYKIKKTNDIALNYSRRINRPKPHDLNPFTDFSDPYNIRIGNPNLKPEYTNSYELSFSKSIKSYFLSSTVYFRKIINPYTRTRIVDSNGVAIVQNQNLYYSRNYGVELNGRLPFTKWWTMLPNLNIFYFQTVGKIPEQSDDRNVNSFTWNIRVINNFNFWKNANLQFIYFIRGPINFLQGRIKPMQALSLGFKKDILKNNKGSLAINISDFARTQRFALNVSDYNYDSDVERRWKSLAGNITFTYRFGKSDIKPTQQKRKDDGMGSGSDMGM